MVTTASRLVKSLQGWSDLRDAAIAALYGAVVILGNPHAAPEARNQARAQCAAAQDRIDDLVALALKTINDDLATVDLIGKLNAAAAAAKKQADVLKDGTAKLKDVAAVIGQVTTVLTELAGIAK